MKKEENIKTSSFVILFLLLFTLFNFFGANTFVYILLMIVSVFLYLTRKIIYTYNYKILILIQIIVLVIISIALIIFSDKKEMNEKNTKEVLKNFYSAKTIYIEAEDTKTYTDNRTSKEDIKIWIKDGNIKEEFFENNKLLRTIIGLNTNKAKWYYHDTKKVVNASVDTSFYLDQYKRSEKEEKFIGIDNENNCNLYEIYQNKTYQIKDSSYNWYQQKRIFCVNQNKIVYFKSYGENLDENGNIPTKMMEHYFKFKKIKINVKINEEVFKEPF